MAEDTPGSTSSPVDVGEYCRRVEDHLTRVNGGHLVRVVGPGFQMVRAWAEEGIPLSAVFRGIELKAERHRAGRSRRPLRIEFCEADVRDVYDGWRRAIGLPARVVAEATEGDEAAPAEARRPSLSRHLERAADRLVRAAGRLEQPEALRNRIARVLDEVVAIREAARKARGQARHELAARLGDLDAELASAARISTPPEVIARLERDAESELAPFRTRLAGDAWNRSMTRTVDRLLRDRYGLPLLELPG